MAKRLVGTVMEKGIQNGGPIRPLTKDRALDIFSILSGIGYGCSVKHLRGNYYVEVPVRLRGDMAYHKESEIISIAKRGGFEALQAGNLLRIA